MVEILLGLSPILLIAFIIFYFFNLHKTLSESPQESRPINPWLVWLGLIPFVGLIWNMVFSVLISLNIRRRCRNENIRCYSSILVPLGIAASIFVGCAPLPLAGPGIALFSAPLWILYMIVIASYRILLKKALMRRYTMAEIKTSRANFTDTQNLGGHAQNLQTLALSRLKNIVDLFRTNLFRISLVIIAVSIAAYFVYDFRHAIWQDSGLWVEPKASIQALEHEMMFYRNIILLMIPFVFLSWILASKRKTVILFLRKFRQEDVNRTLQYAIRRTMFRHSRLLTLDDAAFHPVASNRGQQIIILVVVIVAAGVFFVTFENIRVYLQDGLAGYAQVEGLIKQSAVQLMLFPQYIIREPELIGKIMNQVSLSQLAAIPEYYMQELELLWLFLAGFSTLYFGLGVFLAIIATFYLLALVRLRLISRTHIKNAAALEWFVRQVKQLKNRLHSPTIIAPPATVVAVQTPYWQKAVLKLSDTADTVLFDISDYTKHIEWELAQMLDRHRDKCVFIAQHERFVEWTDKAEQNMEPKVAALVQSVKITNPILYEKLEDLDLFKLSAVLENRLTRTNRKIEGGLVST